jgi:hypothetical protein
LQPYYDMHITDVWYALQRLQRATKSVRACARTLCDRRAWAAKRNRSVAARPVLSRGRRGHGSIVSVRGGASHIRDRGHRHELSRCSAGCYIAEAWAALTLIVLALMAETAQQQLTIASLVGLPVFFAVGYGGSYLTRMLTIRQARPLGNARRATW